MVEGTFEDQIYELAAYIEGLKNVEPGTLANVLQPLVEKDDKEAVIKTLVDAASVLMKAPEKDFIPTFNLLIHLLRSSPSLPTYLPPILKALSSPPSGASGFHLAATVLTTIFNVLPVDSKLRLTVFQSILKVAAASGSFDSLAPQLKNLDHWLQLWEATQAEKREVFLAVSRAAEQAGEDDQVFLYQLQALQTFTPEESTSDEAAELANKLVKLTISRPSLFSFDELSTVDAILGLQRSSPEAYNLYEVFSGGDLEDFDEFTEEYEGWLEKNGYDAEALLRKIRLLTLASLASSTPNRQLPYSQISKSLRIPPEEVELWVIDVIRAGLVEGKLSQLNQEFLIHRSTYRAFGERQWKEVADRLDGWKSSLEGILSVIENARETYSQQQSSDFSGRKGPNRAIEVDS